MPRSFKLRAPAKTAHWAVKLLHDECKVQGISKIALAKRSGIAVKTLHHWWHATKGPNIMRLEKALEVVGLELEVVDVGIQMKWQAVA